MLNKTENIFAKISLYNKSSSYLNETAKFIVLQQSDQICNQNIYEFISSCLENSHSKHETT